MVVDSASAISPPAVEPCFQDMVCVCMILEGRRLLPRVLQTEFGLHVRYRGDWCMTGQDSSHSNSEEKEPFFLLDNLRIPRQK